MSHFSVEKWCHPPAPSQVLCMCSCFCPHWTGGNKEDSVLSPALSCALLFSEGRAVFGLWTVRKSRAMVCLCVSVSEEGRLMSICSALIVHVSFSSRKDGQNPNDCFFKCLCAEEGWVTLYCTAVNNSSWALDGAKEHKWIVQKLVVTSHLIWFWQSILDTWQFSILLRRHFVTTNVLKVNT